MITKTKIDYALWQLATILVRQYGSLYTFGGVEVNPLSIPDVESEELESLWLATVIMMPRYRGLQTTEARSEMERQPRTIQHKMEEECYDLFRRHLVLVRPTVVVIA